MSQNRNNAKKNSSYNDANSKDSKNNYPLARNPKHNKQEPTKGLPQV